MLLELITEFTLIAKYKVGIQKSVMFLYSNIKLLEI